MKAMILAAGKGERMRPLTTHTPKPLLKIAGKPLIQYHIEKLVAAGITDIIINIAWLADLIPQQLGDGSKFGCRLHYSREEVGALETAGGIKQALDLLGNEAFLIVNGDVWTDLNFKILPNTLMPNTMAHLVLVNNPAHHPQGDFGIAGDYLNLENSQKWTYSGIGIYSPELFLNVKKLPAPLGPLLKQAIGQQQVTGQIYQGIWSDIGTPERLAQMEQALTENSLG
ncbi:nucleotidyltransferase family protein [Catenovulum sp. SM1970]|uniref:N-acetylmuramate alpha-1-phosphate uridylyltransferase MurU n=1 Tax=Marinifaba aquimaris TaxID=2741323 RepID=UPI001574CE25|nr:nucleotidyltransferase family protein [Marinifaba aquimaris]NTS77444.1 nucleotidyltransferase family protein [Marinifaba aquimaris]